VIGAIIALARLPGSRTFFQDRTSAAINSIEGTAGLIVCIARFCPCRVGEAPSGQDLGGAGLG
jgi:hypothetical protein